MNNKIGYTLPSKLGRSSKWSTDIAKTYGYPVLHVNADHPEHVYRVGQLAVEYRQKFNKNFFIDIKGYRRYGHNELDEPAFTNPIIYDKIRNE